MKDTIKDFKDLPLDLDFSSPETWPKNWTVGRGGHGFSDNQWSIEYVHGDLSADIYPLPKTINSFLIYKIKQSYKEGANTIIQGFNDLMTVQ